MSKPILLMTRPKEASERFVARLDPKVLTQVQVIIAPLLKIIATKTKPWVSPTDSVIFTSTHAVTFAPDGEGRAAYCVGERTAAKAQMNGWVVKVTALDADDLVNQITAQSNVGPLIHLAGQHRRGDVAGRLGRQGFSVTVQTLYDQVLVPLAPEAHKALSGEVSVIVPLFSPRTAAQFAREVHCVSDVQVLAMSAAIADALGGAFAGRVHIAPASTGEAMCRGVENLLCDDRLS